MCGFSGIISKDLDSSEKSLNLMANSIKHRGPDSSKIIKTQSSNIIFNRLSIVDLSSEGDQPMVSKCKNFIIACNGEIYNFKELIKKFNLTGLNINSDVRVLVELISLLGIEEAFKNIDGMFACYVFDKKNNKHFLVTDFYGQKPLYYAQFNDSIYFSSEISSFHEIGKIFHLNINAESDFLRFGHIFGKKTILKNVHRISKNTIIELDHLGIKKEKKLIKEKKFRTFNFNEFDNLIKSFIDVDVKFGSFLSGGFDSTLISAAASQFKKFDTYTAVFHDFNHNESKIAQQTSKNLGLNHHEVEISKDNFLDFLYNYPRIFSEPLFDPAVIPIYCLSRSAKINGSKMILVGDGGDEIFGGYLDIRKKFNNEFRKIRLLKKTPKFNIPGKFETLLNRISIKFSLETSSPLDLHYKTSFGDYNSKYISEYHDPFRTEFNEYFQKNDFSFFDNELLFSRFLPKLDRPSMAEGIEIRAPFLSDRLINTKKNRLEKLKLIKKYMDVSHINTEKKGFAVDTQKLFFNYASDWIQDQISFIQRKDKKLFNLLKKDFLLSKYILRDDKKLIPVLLLIFWKRFWNLYD